MKNIKNWEFLARYYSSFGVLLIIGLILPYKDSPIFGYYSELFWIMNYRFDIVRTLLLVKVHEMSISVNLPWVWRWIGSCRFLIWHISEDNLFVLFQDYILVNNLYLHHYPISACFHCIRHHFHTDTGNKMLVVLLCVGVKRS